MRISAQLNEKIRNLVDFTTVPCGPGPPLRAVDGTKLAVFVGPFVPNGHPMIVEIFDVRVARQEPQELVDDRLKVQPFRSCDRKALLEVETHLVAESRTDAGSGPVRPVGTVF